MINVSQEFLQQKNYNNTNIILKYNTKYKQESQVYKKLFFKKF